MPTDLPRFTVTLPAHTYELIRAAAAEQGVTKSQLLAEFIEAARDPLERMVTMIRAAKQAPASARASLVATIEAAEKGLLPLMDSAVAQTDLLIDLVKSASGPAAPAGERTKEHAAGADGRRAKARTAARPPPANRGVTPPQRNTPPRPTSKPSKPSTSGKVVRLSTARKARKS